jgi:hypothetical protein
MKTTNLLFRISLDDKRIIQERAKSLHLSVSSYIRMTVLTTNKIQ